VVAPVEIVIYSRAECCLCDDAKAAIERARKTHRLDLEVRVIDIDGDPGLREQYNDQVPVVFVAGRKAFKYRVDPDRLAERVRRLS
jgi:glutaredoxin